MAKNSALKKVVSAPYLVWAALFIVVPLIFVVYYSLVDAGGAFTLDYIKSIGRFKDIMLNSIWLGFVATLICLVIAYPLAYIMARTTKNVQRTMLMLVMLPMWMNLLIRTYSLMILLQDTGILNSFFSFLHLPTRHMINTRGAVILGMVYNYIPYMILPLYSIMSKIDYGLVEAAQDLGASRVNVLRKVILPLSLPGIASGFTMVFVPSVSTFYISKKLGGTDAALIGDVIESQFKAAYNPNFGAALSLVLMILIFICIGLTNRVSGDEEGTVMI